MTKKQIKQLSKYLIEKTNGQFHYEEDYWKEFFSKKEANELEKKIDICMDDKNYNYFCKQLFNCFDDLHKSLENKEVA
jgi:hypothetical protein